MNGVVLQEFLSAMAEARRLYAKEFPDLQLIDTTRSAQEVCLSVTGVVLRALTASLREQVGYFRRDRLRGLFGSQDLALLSEIAEGAGHLEFEDRSLVETESQFIQAVVVAVLTDRSTNQLAVWVKAKKSLGDTSPEKDRLLAYLGGHVRLEDSFERDQSDILRIFARALERELAEEVGQVPRRTHTEPFCIWDQSGADRSKRHMAVVYEYTADFSIFEPDVDRWEFDRESFSVRNIADVDRTSLEKWSALILERLFPIAAQAALFPLPG